MGNQSRNSLEAWGDSGGTASTLAACWRRRPSRQATRGAFLPSCQIARPHPVSGAAPSQGATRQNAGGAGAACPSTSTSQPPPPHSERGSHSSVPQRLRPTLQQHRPGAAAAARPRPLQAHLLGALLRPGRHVRPLQLSNRAGARRQGCRHPAAASLHDRRVWRHQRPLAAGALPFPALPCPGEQAAPP